VLQVIREPDVTRETGSATPLDRHNGTSSRLQPAQWSIVLPSGPAQRPCPAALPSGPGNRPTQRHLRALAYAAGPPCYRIRGRSAVRFAPSIARIRGCAGLVSACAGPVPGLARVGSFGAAYQWCFAFVAV